MGGIKKNPATLVIYQVVNDPEIKSLLLEDYFFQHTSLGWEFKPNVKVMSQLKPQTRFREKAIIQDSPSVDEYGNFNYGIETNVAFMTIPNTIEDGFRISESYAKKIATKQLGIRTANCGKRLFPLNIYGTKDIYKPFPGPGDTIRDDGLIMAFRPFDSNFTITEMHPSNLLADMVDYDFDKTFFGQPGAVVVDVDVLHDHNLKFHTTPTGMTESLMGYVRAKDVFYNKILTVYKKYKKKTSAGLNLSGEFHSLVVEAYSNFKDSSKDRVLRIKNKVPLDDFNISITYAHTKVPVPGYKITDTHGTKGVIVDILPDSHMPRTIPLEGEEVIVADVVKDPLSAIKRSNCGQLFEQWNNQSKTFMVNELRRMDTVGISNEEQFAFLMEYYRHASAYMWVRCNKNLTTTELKFNHLEKVKSEGIYLLLPPNTPNIGCRQVNDIQKVMPRKAGKVQYVGIDGKIKTTKRNITIDTKYMMLLDKTGEDWSTTSITKRQHQGIVVQLGRGDKYLNPYRESPIRFAGESEVGLMAAVMDPNAVAELLDRTNSLTSSHAINRSILEADEPTNIDTAVDRTTVPRGGSMSTQIVKHILRCGGISLEYSPYKPPT